MAHIDVLIVGAGPTGLLLAIWLKTLNKDTQIRIMDRAAGPGTTSRALVVHGRTLEFYRQLGIADAVVREGTVIETVSLSSKGHQRGLLALGNVGKGQSKFPFVLSYPQDRHEKLLVKHLMSLGVDVEWNQEVVRVVQSQDQVTTTTKDGERIDALYVAGCDGTHSTVRRECGIQLEGSTYPSRFYVADGILEQPKSLTSSLEINFGAQGFGLCFPIDSDGGVRVLGNVPDTANEDVTFEDIQFDHVEELTRRPLSTVNWSSIYKVHHRLAEKFRLNRVFLVGDSAHQHSPAGGQGMNTGLGDATNLAWKLVDVLDRKSNDALLDTYQAERIGFARILVSTTDRVFGMVVNKGWLGYIMRTVVMSRILPLLWKLPFVPHRVFRLLSQIAITYRGGVKMGGLKPGDRLPWIDFGELDNFESLNQNCWQIHRYGGRRLDSEESVAGHPVIYFPSTTGCRKAGLLPDVDFLVRPDGHIGMMKKRSDNSEIVEFLRERI